MGGGACQCRGMRHYFSGDATAIEARATEAVTLYKRHFVGLPDEHGGKFVATGAGSYYNVFHGFKC